MNKGLPIWILEPEVTEKRDLSARKFCLLYTSDAADE